MGRLKAEEEEDSTNLVSVDATRRGQCDRRRARRTAPDRGDAEWPSLDETNPRAQALIENPACFSSRSCTDDVDLKTLNFYLARRTISI